MAMAATEVTVVTEDMITEACRHGDLERLQRWARRGVRVTTTAPLLAAARGGFCEVVWVLATELGADVNEATPQGVTALILAADSDHLDVVQCLVTELGASIGNEDNHSGTALLVSARSGHYAILRWFLEHTDASMLVAKYAGGTVWDNLTYYLGDSNAESDEDLVELTALLRVMVLRSAPPATLVALLSPEPTRVVQEGARLRARLPAYFLRRRALMDALCPVLPPLLDLVHGYMELTTTEELWATGLGEAP
jgi:hypothetical protein